MREPGPHVVVFSSLFPSRMQPGAGLFIRERMFRVGRQLPLCVVAPTPWFPLQGLLARFKPGFRPGAPRFEQQSAHEVWFPRFFSLPGLLKRLDGLSMALAAWPRLRALKRAGRLDLIDAHFGYPDGYAATLLGRWLGVPVCITLRGTETRHAKDLALAPLLRQALLRADRVFAVSASLAAVAHGLGVPAERVQVVGNGVDLDKFTPQPQPSARQRLGLPEGVPVLVTVGGLVERKGFHRVMACLPALRRRFPGLVYLVVGGPSLEGDWTARLHKLSDELGLGETVRFLGPLPPQALSAVLSAADVFVLATRNEGWANVLLEAMACGLPVVTTDVGGNKEVVSDPALGIVVPFDDEQQLHDALADALARPWNRQAIRAHAAANTWDQRVQTLLGAFKRLAAR
ncbi:glycosyltransferase [Aquincola sp. MAHUQ-54]|uniref:Glycosyltransferase n=1 Tax=Aquincola agrisoli TaxID=3119538 RepID=A0AAW9QPE5_9BURK